MALVDDLAPIGVLPFQLEPEAHSLRHREGRGRVIDREVVDVRGKAYAVRYVVRPAVRHELFDLNGGRHGVERKVTRIDCADAIAVHEPESAIRGLGQHGSGATGDGTRFNSDGGVDHCPAAATLPTG